MDRFFSKLDLRDIKIKPEGSRFLPDEDEIEVVAEPESVEAEAEAQVVEYVPVEPVWSSEPAPVPAAVIYDEDDYDAPPVHEEEHHSQNGDVLKVSAKSRPSAVAGAIAGVVRENGRAEVQAIGAGATNQAVKAVAIARDYLLETGIDAVCLPAFIDVMIENEERTAIRLLVEPR